MRDAITAGWPVPLEIEEHTHAGHGQPVRRGRVRACRSRCCAAPRAPTCRGTRRRLRRSRCPFTGEQLTAVAALNPDVAIVHAQRADRAGNVQMWGITGVQKEAVLAAAARARDRRGDRRRARRRCPARSCCRGSRSTRSPWCPAARAPSYAQGYYDRDNDAYLEWERSAGTARRSRALARASTGNAHGARDREPHRRRDDDRRRGPGAARRPGGLRRDRAARRAAANLARRLHAPDLVLVYESGTIDTRPDELPLSIGDGVLVDTALSVVSVPEVFNYWLQAGRIDVGFLSGAQIDRFANINTTVIGEYDEPDVRLPGSGGAPEIAASCREVIVVMRHRRRAFVDQVDFVTSSATARGQRPRPARAARRGAGPGDHRPRRARARPRVEGTGAHRAAPASRSSRCGRRPAGRWRSPSTSGDTAADRRELGALRSMTTVGT